MLAGKVVGSLVSTRKNEKLVGCKFMIVETLVQETGTIERMIAVDDIGAGIGEYVLIARGSAARVGTLRPDSPIDAAIVGIIDDVDGLERL